MHSFKIPKDGSLYVLFASVAAGLALRLWRIPFQLVMFRDETTYAFQIKHILNGTVFEDPTYYTFPPAFGYLAAPLALLSGNCELAGRLVSALAGAATAIPVYLLARDLFGRRAAAVAAVSVSLMPALLSIAVMSEPTYGFFVTLGLYLANRAYKKGRARDYAFFGLAFAAAYLCRPEGLFVFLAYLALLLILLVKDGGVRRRHAAIAAVSVSGFLVLAFPYMIQLRQHFGAWEISGKTRINLAKAKASEVMKPGDNYDTVSAQLYQDLEKKKGSVIGNVVGQLSAIAERYPGNLAEELAELKETAGIPLLAGFLLGAAFAFFDKDRLKVMSPFLASTAPFFVIPMVFVLQRLVVPYLPAFIILASYAVTRVSEIAAKKLKSGESAAQPVMTAVFAGALLASCTGNILPQTNVQEALDGSPNYSYYYTLRQLAQEAKPYIKPGSKVITRNNIFAYYAGAEYLPIPVGDYAELIKYAKKEGGRYLLYGPMEMGMRPELMPVLLKNGNPDPNPNGDGSMRLVFIQGEFLLYEINAARSRW